MRVVVALLATTLSSPAVAQQLRVVRTQEVFRFGGENAAEPYAFAATPRLAVDRQGSIFARVPVDGAVLQFDPEGRFVRRFGRRGDGPGEFQVADGHGFIGDTLWVRNWPTPRISLFAKDGSHIATRRTPYDFGYSFAAGASGISGLLEGGRVYIIPPSPVIGVERRVSLPVLIGPMDMGRVDTIVMVPNPKGMFLPQVGTWWFEPVPSSPIVAVASTGASIAVVSWSDDEPGVMRVRVVLPTGVTHWERQFRVPVQAIPRQVRDSLVAVAATKARPQIEAARRRGASVSGSIESLAEHSLSLPKHYAPARAVLFGTDGTVWIEQMVGLRGGTWYVLDSGGTPVFQVLVPQHFTLHAASLQWLWGTVTDELDVPYMVKLRIVR